MALSVEELKTVLTEFEIGNLAIFDDSDRPARGAERIAQAAIRELIALKEAEPVGWICQDDVASLSGVNYIVTAISNSQESDDDIALIRKPE